MSLNLGNAVTDAAFKLKDNPDWQALVAGMGEAASAFSRSSLSSPQDARHDATAYARALGDVFIAFAAATGKVHQNQVKLPPVKPYHEGKV